MEEALAMAKSTLPRLQDALSESEYGRIAAVSGPVVTAEHLGSLGTAMYELVRVGPQELIGEVIKLDGDLAIIQVYEETAGLRVGDPVRRCKAPLAVELGPGILRQIYDGIQRPLDIIANDANSCFIPRGVGARALDGAKAWEWTPSEAVHEGDIVSGGTIYGVVQENRLIEHRVMVPPNIAGRVTYLAPAGTYCVDDTMMELDTPKGKKTLTMVHLWAVRHARPVAERLVASEPLITGQRCLDSLFPTVLGGANAVPGGFGVGKTVVSQAISKYSNAHGVIYTAVGERGNEVAEILMDFPELTVQHNGEDVSIMNRTAIIANTSNMCVAAREASIYTGITLAEYYRDMGYDWAVFADSTSRWAEALRELAGRLAELPSDAGYPAYMASRLAQFYERAGRVKCLGSPDRKGSVTVVGAVSPPGGDLMSCPVCKATQNAISVFWALDKRLAQHKHFPAVNWLQSYSSYTDALTSYYDTCEADFPSLRRRSNEIMRNEDALTEIVQLVGRDALSEADKITLDVAQMIKEDFLSQNSYVPWDYYCPFTKTAGMLRAIIKYDELARDAVERGATWAVVRSATAAVRTKIAFSKQVDPKMSEVDLRAEFNGLIDDICRAFAAVDVSNL